MNDLALFGRELAPELQRAGARGGLGAFERVEEDRAVEEQIVDLPRVVAEAVLQLAEQLPPQTQLARLGGGKLLGDAANETAQCPSRTL